MADTKITALTALTAADPINDVCPIVDVSDTTMAASGTTKKISINNILGCSGTATLASATITGDLTVDTTTLVVNPSGYADRVGIVTATPAYPLDVNGRISYNGAIGEGTNQTVSSSGVSLQFGLGSAWTSQLFYVSGSTAMTLNSTGLGIGTGPTQPLTVRSSAAAIGMFHSTNVNGPYVIFQNSTANFGDIGSELGITGGGSASNLTINSRLTSNLCFAVSDSVKMRIDSTGNVGIGVTPSAWATLRGLQNGRANIVGYVSNAEGAWLTNNAFYDGSWKYQTSAQASHYQQLSGVHSWSIAGTGTAGASAAVTSGQSYTVSVLGSSTLAQWQAFFSALAAIPTVGQVITATATGSIVGGGTVTQNIAFTQAMTLDASGNLLVGTVTAPSGTKIGSIAKLGKVNVEGTNTVTVTTSATPLARAFDTGGLFFVSGYNNVGGSRGWWLVAAGGATPVVIASDNSTGLTVSFTSPSSVLNMNTTSGSLSVTAISLTNQGV